MEETTTAPGGAEGLGDDAASSRFGRAREAATGAVRDGYNRVREKVEDIDMGAVTDQVRGYVRSNPGKALLFSVGIGLIIGLMLRGSGDGDDD